MTKEYLDGTGKRDNKGKPAFNLVPLHLLEGCADVLSGGARKYGTWNWTKGMAWSISVACLLRHLFAWFYKGEDIDKESGCHHIDHVIANALFIKHNLMNYPEGDDRPEAWNE